MTRQRLVLGLALASAATLAPAASADAVEVAKGELIVCNHSGYSFNVFADGPVSTMTDDLAGSFDECTDWPRVGPGLYDVGFAYRVNSQQASLVMVRIKRDKQVIYRRVGEMTKATVSVGQATRVDLFIPRG